MLPRPGLWSQPPSAATPASSEASTAAAARSQSDAVSSATPAELTGMLFAKALEKMDTAREHLVNGHPGLANPHLLRAQDIVDELRSSLNPEAGDLALSLDGVYTWVLQQLVTACVKGDIAALDEAKTRLEPIADAWKQAVLKQASA